MEKKIYGFPLLKIFKNISPDKPNPFRETAFDEKTPVEVSSNQSVTSENIKNSDVIRQSSELQRKNTTSKFRKQNRATSNLNKSISTHTTTG